MDGWNSRINGKWYGTIGYANTEETEPGIWEETIIEKQYYGELDNNRYRRQNNDYKNDDIVLYSDISIIADPFAIENYSKIVYVEINNQKWKVTSVEPKYPRLVLTVGGVYNEQQIRITDITGANTRQS